jgi:purine/pyrimidine-nucleoside phosphorylase
LSSDSAVEFRFDGYDQFFRSGFILRGRAGHNLYLRLARAYRPLMGNSLENKGQYMLKHNTYFDGKVQSVGFERNGARATVGVIAPGEYHFNTGAAERMTVISGQLRAKNTGGDWVTYAAGTYFEIPANSGFDVAAVGGPAAYLCEFLAT